MIIKKMQINGFGNIENKSFELENGLNILYGKNETGKSTFTNFIRSIFYGINKNKAGQEFSDFERFKPWRDIDFSGKIEYEFDNKNYTAFRDFNRNNCKIYDESGNDITNDFGKDKSRGSEIGIEHFGIDEETFNNTVFVMQNNVGVNIQSQKSTIQKLTNMLQSGNENTSVEKIVAKLQKKCLDEIGSERTRNKPINIIEKDISDKEQIRERLTNNRERKTLLDDKNESLKKQIESVEEDIKQIDKVLEIKEKYVSLLDDKERTYDLTLKIKKKEQEDKVKKSKEQLKYGLALLIFIVIITCFALVYFKYYKWCFVEIIVAIIGGIFMCRTSKLAVEEPFTSDFDVVKEELNKKEGKELDKLCKNGIKANYISKRVQELKSLSAGLVNKKNDMILEMHKIKLEEDSMKENIEKLYDVEEQLTELKAKRENLILKSKILNIAIQKLNESYEELKSEAIPEMEKSIKKMIGKTTNEKYDDILYNNEEGILVKNVVGEVVPISKLSMGTIDQMYLGFRLGILNKAEDLPVILDESFAYYDDERLENMLKTLSGLNRQVIVMTCSTREKNILDKLKLDYNYIEL